MLSVLGELRAEADWAHRCATSTFRRRTAPSTPLGELDAAFWGDARPLRRAA